MHVFNLFRSALHSPFPSQDSSKASDRQRWQWVLQRALPVICLLALLTRTWRLAYHSVWFDEAVSLQWAGSDASFIWQKTFPLIEDKHPPIYYLTLHYWQAMLDWIGMAQSDAALRLLGALLGVVTVWAITQLAGKLSGRATGLLMGLFAALSPILVWYSQELRMFQPATTGTTVAAFALWQAWTADTRSQQWRWWGLCTLALTAALYTYLFSAFLMPAIGLTLLLLLWYDNRADRWQRFASGVVALGITTALYLPLALNAWAVNGNEGDPGVAFANFGTNLWRLLQIFTLWRVTWPSIAITATLCFFALVFVSGLLLPTRHSSTLTPPSAAPRGWLLLWIGIPLLIGNLLQSRSGSVFSEDRYFLFLTPFVLWAMARGIVVGGQWLRGNLAVASDRAGQIRRHHGLRLLPVLGGGMTVLLLLLALSHLWTPAMYREQWRAAATYIAEYHAASPALSDTVVAHVDYTRLPLEWYLRQQYTFDQLPLYHPYGGTLTPEQIESTIAPPLQGIIELGTATLWLTQSHLEGVDDARLVEGWLQDRFPVVTELYPAGIKLSGFALQSQFMALPTLAPSAHFPATTLAPGVELTACEVLTPVVAAEESVMHPPSGWVHVRLWWRATGPITDDYIATAEVIGVEGAWGVRLYRANEALRRFPTSTWQPGTITRDEVDINLNPLTHPRTYPVVIGLMDSAGESTGNTAQCGTVVVD